MGLLHWLPFWLRPKPTYEFTCTDCQTELEAIPRNAGGTCACSSCGREFDIPWLLWPGGRIAKYLKDPMEGFVGWPVGRMEELEDLLVFYVQMLPKSPQKSIEKRKNSVEFATVREGIQDLIEHVQRHADLVLEKGVYRTVAVHAIDLFFHVTGLATLQINPYGPSKRAPNPMYYLYRLAKGKMLVDRAVWVL